MGLGVAVFLDGNQLVPRQVVGPYPPSVTRCPRLWLAKVPKWTGIKVFGIVTCRSDLALLAR